MYILYMYTYFFFCTTIMIFCYENQSVVKFPNNDAALERTDESCDFLGVLLELLILPIFCKNTCNISNS